MQITLIFGTSQLHNTQNSTNSTVSISQTKTPTNPANNSYATNSLFYQLSIFWKMPSIQTISFCFFVFSGRARRGQRTAALYSCYETAAMVQTYAHHSGRFFQKSPALFLFLIGLSRTKRAMNEIYCFK